MVSLCQSKRDILLLVHTKLCLSTKLSETIYILKALESIPLIKWVYDDRRPDDSVGTSTRWGLTFGWLLCGSCLPCLRPGESQHWPSNSLSTYCLSDCTGTGRSNIRTDLSADLEMAACPKMYQEERQLILLASCADTHTHTHSQMYSLCWQGKALI